jgi:serine/threonine protein kinase HipA of HipAB toxin-antitoxin module
VDGRWCRPLGATPTTHILKLPLGLVGGRRLDLSHSVHNEWLCAQLLREMGLPVAVTDIATFGDETVLAAKRVMSATMRQGALSFQSGQIGFIQRHQGLRFSCP